MTRRIPLATTTPADFTFRVLRDAFLDADAAYWLRRAAAFETAAPRPGDHPGRATPQQLEEARRRCQETAAACRARASLTAASDQVLVDTLAAVALSPDRLLEPAEGAAAA